ncbi:low temperature requirement protein A [Actinocrispum wychmicini]|uniref:Low temperature requirement A protein (LtrA) n=1 Tax=Actinocrispum wychmicini TaxID=1213861 RepID=A0A4R2J410_9PSEU|nr:low temperature requirement protein A [Actinocrispum wychmicini]TCO52814.1 low temperature requirement A protein (LtrA) [Actinocrispum wychmicini]
MPDAFGGGAWAFAVGYVVVVAVHAFSFARARGFSLRPAHFAERHRLLLIIALGETIIAIGGGASRRLAEWPVVLAVVLAMVLISALWWIFFVGDHHEDGERALAGTTPEARAERARWAYSVAYLVVIAGLVATAAGLHAVVHEPTHRLDLAGSITLAGGVVAFLLGIVLFLRVLRVGSWMEPAVGAAVCSVTVLPGLWVNALVQLAGLAVVLIAVAAIRARTRETPHADLDA